MRSLAQIKRVERFANLASLCVHGCRLTRMSLQPRAPACRAELRELNLSSNRIARLEGFPALPELRVLDLTNNRLESLAGIDEGACADAPGGEKNVRGRSMRSACARADAPSPGRWSTWTPGATR